MGRYREAVCRICRREGEKLFLKGARCNTAKCAVERQRPVPGAHGRRRRKPSDYGIRLREKQKLRRRYGIQEKQFRKYFQKAGRGRGETGGNLLQLLERRLDNTVFRLSLATTRSQARQLVRHRHFLINGKRMDIPSYLVRTGDVVELKAKSQPLAVVEEAMEQGKERPVPGWLAFDKETRKGKVTRLPTRKDITAPVEEHYIVEFYSC